MPADLQFTRLAIGLFSLALFVSITILWKHQGLHGSLPGCGGDASCDGILTGHWSAWGPLSLARLGVFFYASLVLLSLGAGFATGGTAPTGLLGAFAVLCLAGGGFTLWLIGLQGWVIGHFCIYCMSAHLSGLAGMFLALKQLRKRDPRALSAWRVAPAAGLLAAMIAVHAGGGQIDVRIETPAAAGADQPADALRLGDENPGRDVALLGGNLTFDTYTVPLLGPPDAPYVLVELFDYACPNCRDLFAQLESFRDAHPGMVAVAPYPVPMHPDCNPGRTTPLSGWFRYSCDYVRIARAVWLADRKRFPAFHAWLMTGGKPPVPAKAQAHAESLVGAEAFARALQDPSIGRWGNQGIQVFTFIDARTLPRLIIGDRVITYGSSNRKDFHKLLAAELGLAETP